MYTDFVEHARMQTPSQGVGAQRWEDDEHDDDDDAAADDDEMPMTMHK